MSTMQQLQKVLFEDIPAWVALLIFSVGMAWGGYVTNRAMQVDTLKVQAALTDQVLQNRLDAIEMKINMLLEAHKVVEK